LRDARWSFWHDYSRHGISRVTRPKKAFGYQRWYLPGLGFAVRHFADRNNPAGGRIDISTRLNTYADSGAFLDAKRKAILRDANLTTDTDKFFLWLLNLIRSSIRQLLCPPSENRLKS